MSVRLAVLFLVAALTVGARGNALYQRYLSVELSSAPPFSAEPIGDGIVVTRVDTAAECYQGWHDSSRPQPGDRILEIRDGRGQGGEIRGLFDYGAYLKPVNSDEAWTMVVGRQHPDGLERVTLRMPPAAKLRWDTTEWLARLAVDLYLPFLAIAAGLLIGWLRSGNNPACLAALLFFSLSLTIGLDVTQFAPYWRDVALLMRVTAVHVLPFLVYLFFIRFPAPSPIARSLPWLTPVFFVETIVSAGVGLSQAVAVNHSFAAAARLTARLGSAGLAPDRLDTVFTVSAVIMIVVALVSVAMNTARASSVDERRRLRIIAAGAIAGLLPAVALFAFAATGRKTPLGMLLVAIPLIGLFPMSFGYAVVRHRVFGIRLILRKGLTYALVSRGFLVAEALIVVSILALAAAPLMRSVQPDPSVLLASGGTLLAVAFVAVGVRRVNRRILLTIDRRFFRASYDAWQILTDLSRAIRRMASRPDQLLEGVTAEIVAALHPSRLAIFLVPGICTRLVPIPPPRGACWKAAPSGGAESTFWLFVDEGPGTAPEEVALPHRSPFARVSLQKHLASAVAGDPEALEVEPFPPRATQAGANAPAGDQRADCLEDAALMSRFGARLVVPVVTNGRALGFLLLGEKRSEEPYSSEDKVLLLTVAAQMAIALDYAQLISQVAEQAADQAAIKRELQIAQEVQAQLFPHERPAMRSLRYSGVCRAARGVGGDFYDYLPLTGNRLGLAVADIAGKGLPAALLMASLQALLRSHAPTYATSLGELGRELNRHLCETSDGARFATLFFAVYHDDTQELTYLNAGHVAPMIVGRSEGGAASVRRLDSGGMVLGLFGDQVYLPGSVTLQPGERLLVFSDGVTEATNAEGEMFGDDRLAAAVLGAADSDIDALASRVVEEVDRFVAGAPQQDDLTVITAEVTAGAGAPEPSAGPRSPAGDARPSPLR